MLTPPAYARRILCLRSQFISAGRDPKNPTATFNSWPQLTAFFKIFKFSEPSLLDMSSSTLHPRFLSGGLLLQMMIVIFFTRGCKTAPSDYAPGLRDPSSSKPYQTK